MVSRLLLIIISCVNPLLSPALKGGRRFFLLGKQSRGVCEGCPTEGGGWWGFERVSEVWWRIRSLPSGRHPFARGMIDYEIGRSKNKLGVGYSKNE
jgi:hypothetical protein